MHMYSTGVRVFRYENISKYSYLKYIRCMAYSLQQLDSMKIAIPYWHGRVSPVFDVAQNLLLVDVENKQETRRTKMGLHDSDAFNRTQHILQFGAGQIICGAISESLLVLLLSAGVGVYANVCGPVEEVLKAFLQGTLENSNFRLPGSNDRWHRHRKRRGRKQTLNYNGI